MTIRELAIAKLQQLPESFLPEISDFIDCVMHKHQYRIAEPKLPDDIAKAWAKWFEEVDRNSSLFETVIETSHNHHANQNDRNSR